MLPFLIVSALCGCEVFVLEPLDLFNSRGNLRIQSKFENWCDQLRDAGVKGIMLEVWWDYTEPSPKNYKWDGYETVFSIIRNKGLKIIPVFSFNQCQVSIGDSVYIGIPSFVWEGTTYPAFTDSHRNKDNEYISFAYDNIKIGPNNERTPLEMYRDWMTAFKSEFSMYINDGTIVEIQVGVGPLGELRYPSFRWMWSYPGCGEFQCYDEQFIAKFKKDAASIGHSEWDLPRDTGDYNVKPGGTSFWTSEYKSEYGKFFINWYQQQLIDHGSNVLRIARELFPNTRLTCKLSSVHWQYTTECRCAEVAAGFNVVNGNNGYEKVISMLKQHNVDVCFSCLEMNDDYNSAANPPALVREILEATKRNGLRFEGQNLLQRYDWDAFNQIKSWVNHGLSTFTYLRMDDALMNGRNWENFKAFVNQMK